MAVTTAGATAGDNAKGAAARGAAANTPGFGSADTQAKTARTRMAIYVKNYYRCDKYKKIMLYRVNKLPEKQAAVKKSIN